MHTYLFHIDTAIVTPHTVVRRFREQEGSPFWELLQDNQSYIDDHLPDLFEQIHSPEEAELFARRQLADWLCQKAFSFIIWDTGQVKPIGFLRFGNYQPERLSARLDGFLDRAYTGRGLMTEVVQYLLPFAFQQLQLERLEILTYADNYAAQRLARRCGFHREGDLRAALRKPSGDFFDAMLLAITRQEYHKS